MDKPIYVVWDRCRAEGLGGDDPFAADLASEDAWQLFADLRRGEFPIFDIAMTDLSIMFDEARRLHWLDCGDPPRPGPAPAEILVHHDGFVTEPLESTTGGPQLSHEEQRQRFECAEPLNPDRVQNSGADH